MVKSFYKGKAYKRSNTSTVEGDRFELRRIAMEGTNMHYEDRKSSSKELKFNVLEAKLKREAGIARINKEYIHSISKPNFDLSENRIKIILPITEIDQLDWEIKS